MESSIRTQIEEQYSSLASAIENPDTTAADLGHAYGEMGHLFMATRHREAAAACYLHAWALAPGERRWPYYLGHVSRTTGAFARSATFFAEALALGPDDVPTLLWLGEVHLAQGRPEAAEPPFEQALALEPRSVLARFGLGRAALARRDHARAALRLEEALALDPRATSLALPARDGVPWTGRSGQGGSALPAARQPADRAGRSAAGRNGCRAAKPAGVRRPRDPRPRTRRLGGSGRVLPPGRRAGPRQPVTPPEAGHRPVHDGRHARGRPAAR